MTFKMRWFAVLPIATALMRTAGAVGPSGCAAAQENPDRLSLFQRFGRSVTERSTSLDDLALDQSDAIKWAPLSARLPAASEVRTSVYPLRGDDRQFFEDALAMAYREAGMCYAPATRPGILDEENKNE